MTITRCLFDFSSGTGASSVSDTGPPVDGFLHQVRWESLGSADTGSTDTGADLQIFSQQREADTGDGFLVLNDNDILGADKLWMPRTTITTTAGVTDTGTEDMEPVAFANDRPRVRVIPGSAGVKGRLYLWFKG